MCRVGLSRNTDPVRKYGNNSPHRLCGIAPASQSLYAGADLSAATNSRRDIFHPSPFIQSSCGCWDSNGGHIRDIPIPSGEDIDTVPNNIMCRVVYKGFDCKIKRFGVTSPFHMPNGLFQTGVVSF
jgi:hypothetical protein